MIDIQTIKFLKMVEELTALSRNDIQPFSKCAGENKHSHIFYDENNTHENGTYKVPLNFCTECGHHDIVSYYESCCDGEYTVGVSVEDDSKYVQIDIDDEIIIIKNGEWCFA